MRPTGVRADGWGLSTEGSSRAWSVLVATAAAVVALALRYPFLNVAYGSDEGYYALAARQWLAGLDLYGDLAFCRPPLLALPYALGRLVTGHSADGFVRLGAAVWSALTVALIAYFLVRRLPRYPALFATTLFTVWSASYSLQNEANSETWMLPLWTAAGLLLLALAEQVAASAEDHIERRVLWLSGVAGALVGLATMFKQPAGIGVLLPLAALVAYRLPWRSWLSTVLAYVAGFASVMAASLAVFALNGEGIAYLYRGWFGMGGYVSGERLASPLSSLVVTVQKAWLPYFVPVAIVLLVALFVLPRWRERCRPASYLRFGLVWFAISLIAVSASGRFFGHYFIQTMPALALVFSASLSLAGQSLAERSSRAAAAFARVGFVLAGLACAIALMGQSMDIGLSNYYAERRKIAQTFARRADRYLPKGGSVTVWGVHQASAAYSERTPASKVLWYTYGFFGEPGGATFLGQSFPSLGDVALAELESGALPDAFVLSSALDKPDPQDPRIVAALQRVLEREYDRVYYRWNNGNPYSIWLRKAATQ